MKLIVLPIALLTGAFAMQTTRGMAQVQQPVPGGATGANVFCIQAGDLTSGSFVATYLRRGAGTWEERNQEGGAFKYEEKGRDEQAVELFDSGRSTSILFDFANKTITGMSNADFAKPLPKLGPQANEGDVVYILVADAHEHLGQLIAYARQNGIVPPWTVEAQKKKGNG